MLFNSYVFVLGFLPPVLAAWWLLRRHPRPGFVFLTAASYVMYGWWDWRFCTLLLASTLVDYVAGKRIFLATDATARRSWLALSVGTNLGLLGFFKYSGFLAESANQVASWLHVGGALPVPHIVLPVGISFYTFQSMSYSIDIYRRQSEPAEDLWRFAAYVSMFPQLIAGPIVRYNEIEEQLRAPREHMDWHRVWRGIVYFTLGMGQKVLIADRVAAAIDPLFLRYGDLRLVGSWQVMLGYTCQIYFDFAGYSNMAIGLGFMLGFVFPSNFESPYKSASIAEFWRRWHISLSTWLRDYLYVPLGGSRHGTTRTLWNLFIVMFLGGLWHGAAWTFVIWGLYHGALLVIHQAGKIAGLPRLPRGVAIPLTFVAVVVGWVFFRSDSLEMSQALLYVMAGGRGVEASLSGALTSGQFVTLVGALAIVFALPNVRQIEERTMPAPAAALALAVLLVMCILRFGDPSPFLYFQF
ncbi:MAG TPA: MBOAT family protein [Acidobacteriota bacterium]